MNEKIHGNVQPERNPVKQQITTLQTLSRMN